MVYKLLNLQVFQQAVIKEAQKPVYSILETQQKLQLNTSVQTDLFQMLSEPEVIERVVGS